MKSKRGQVTVFIIIAIILVVIAMLIYSFYPKIKSALFFDTDNPETYIRNCIKEDFESVVETISLQGGSFEPDFFYMYQGHKLEYLCYTEKNFEVCSVQRPFLREHVEQEISKNLKKTTDQCFDSLKEKYQSKGYSIDLKKGKVFTELLPGKVLLNFESYKLTVSKEQNTDTYSSFSAFLNNNLYEFISIATNMVKWEASIGEADIYNYNLLYNDLRFEKFEQSDGTKVYILTNKKRGEKFQFASRSLAFPPGYF